MRKNVDLKSFALLFSINPYLFVIINFPFSIYNIFAFFIISSQIPLPLLCMSSMANIRPQCSMAIAAPTVYQHHCMVSSIGYQNKLWQHCPASSQPLARTVKVASLPLPAPPPAAVASSQQQRLQSGVGRYAACMRCCERRQQ